VEAFVYLRVRPGHLVEVRNQLTGSAAARRSTVVIGDWDVLCLIDGPDLSTIGTGVISDIHVIIILGGCYVHVRAVAGAAAGLYERFADIAEVSGAAVLGGRWDLIACVAEPWEVASGLVLEKVQALPGVRETSTLVSVDYEEPSEDRDQFSSWS